MSLLARLAGLASSHEMLERDALAALCDQYGFLPRPEAIEVPPGWLALLFRAVPRLSSVVAPSQWGSTFKVTSVGERNGALDIVTYGGNAHVQAIARKVQRMSQWICPDCGTPAIPFTGKLGQRPHCSVCLQRPALLRDLESVLGWRAGIVGPEGKGIRVRRIPRTLRASFKQWHQASGLDLREIQPWDLETWLRDLARAQRNLQRAFQ